MPRHNDPNFVPKKKRVFRLSDLRMHRLNHITFALGRSSMTNAIENMIDETYNKVINDAKKS